MTTKNMWWRPKEKLQNNPEMEKRLDVPSGYVIVDRDEWKKLQNRINIGPVSIGLRMLTGAIIGLFIISFFVLSVDDPDPDWGKYWMIRPLVITPLAAAFGMLSFFLKDFIHPRGKFLTILVFSLSLVVFVIALWLGFVLGLDGTLWD
jgi:hypothetical protein